MPYGSDITEGIPYVLSNPSGATTYSATGEAYDVAIAGLPFFLFNSDDSPYRRVTAQYRKQQIDQTREAGEQTLTGWWVRSQSSFHFGAGIKYFEPQQEESLRFQYTESKGLDIWTRGQVTLLNDTASFYAGAAAAQLIGVNDGTNDCIYVTDGTALKKITTGGTSTTITQAGTASTIYSLTTDGSNYYFINGTKIHKGSVGATPADSEIYAATVTRATIRYVKQRLIAAIGNALYELDAAKSYSSTITNAAVVAGTVTLTTSAVHNLVVGDTVNVIDLPAPFTAYNTSATVTAVGSTTTFSYVVGSATVTSAATTGKFIKTTLPTALYTHPNPNWVWSSIAEGPQAIYVSGYDPNGTSSSVFKVGLDPAVANSLGFPTLETPTVVIDMPQGERINDFDVYLGTYAILATNLGFRAGVSDINGNIQYGPLLFNQAPCNSIAFRDSFAYMATLIDGAAGLVRVDLSSTVLASSLYFPWAWDLVAGGTTTTASQVAFFGNSDRAAFTNGNNTWAESTTKLVANGYLRTGYIRYNTLETKIFKLMQARVDTTNGGLTIQSVDSSNNFYTLGVFSQSSTVPEININYPQAAQEYLGFKFTLSRSATDSYTTNNLTSAAYTSSTVAVFTHSSSAAVEIGQTITIANVAGGNYNGSWVVTAVTGTTFTVVGTGFTNTAGANGTFSIPYNKGPLFTGYQLKSLPAVPRQRLIQYPLSCFDHESDHFGVESGYEGSAYARMSQLEQIENVGDTIQIQDFRTGESYIGLIEEMDFRNSTPSDRRFSGYGGLLLVTIRTV